MTARARVVLFGGFDLGSGRGVTAETWEWDGRAWELRATSGPNPRMFHSMAYDSNRSMTVLFGGQSATVDVRYGDTWEWDGKVWELRATSP